MTSKSPSQSAPANSGVDFEDALRVAAEIAAHSPSSHNCQPWALGWAIGAAARHAATRLLGENVVQAATEYGHAADEDEYLVLALDRERQLTSLPWHALEMLISCGAYGEILLQAMAAQGWRADRVHFVNPAPAAHTPWDDSTYRIFGDRWPDAWAPLCVIRLRHSHTSSVDLAELRETARARHTNRGPYRPESIDSAVLTELSTPRSTLLSQAAPEHEPKVTVRHVVSDAERAEFADLVSRHGGRDFSHPLAWQETHSFIRRSEADAEARGDGFTLGQLFGHLAPPRRYGMRIALAPATMRLLQHVGYHRVLARQLAAMVRRSPAAVALCFAGDSPSTDSIVCGGAAMANYWLAATRAGLVLHPVSVILQHDDVRDELEHRLGLPGRAFFLSRLGCALTGFPPSHRLSASSTLRLV